MYAINPWLSTRGSNFKFPLSIFEYSVKSNIAVTILPNRVKGIMKYLNSKTTCYFCRSGRFFGILQLNEYKELGQITSKAIGRLVS